jgi:hypothetical protein
MYADADVEEVLEKEHGVVRILEVKESFDDGGEDDQSCDENRELSCIVGLAEDQVLKDEAVEAEADGDCVTSEVLRSAINMD